jgi:hypothetical protein
MDLKDWSQQALGKPRRLTDVLADRPYVIRVCSQASFTDFDGSDIDEILESCLAEHNDMGFQRTKLLRLLVDGLKQLDTNQLFKQKFERVVATVSNTALEWKIEVPRPILVSVAYGVVASYYVETLILSGILDIESGHTSTG